MALTGQLLADFTSFTQASADAVTSLKSFETGAGNVTKQLDAVSNSLSGVKIVQQATLAAEAVDRLGGISKLTDAELAKIGATATEAAAKLKAMGQDVPPGIQAIADASKAAAGGSDDMGKSWVLRIAEGQLLRDAVREALNVIKEMAVFLPELALRGAAVGDVEESFVHLSTAAGHTSDVLLGELRAGTHGTIDDFELMKRANKDMAAGLELTDDQFRLLADGAFALAKATGGSTAEALDKMSDALVTGRAKGVAMLTGKIDLKKAEEDYAASLGGTVDQLSAEQKLYADQQAILAGVAAGLGRVGEQTDSLDDKVQQVDVSWKNFEDDLGKQIARSPVIAAGFDGIKASLAAAFGTDQAHLIDAIVAKIDSGAIIVVDFALAASEGARDFNIAWSLIKTAVLSVETGLVTMGAAAASTFAAISRGAADLPFATQATRDHAAAATADADNMWLLAKGLDAEALAAAKGITGNSDFDKTLDALESGLMTTRDTMLALGDAHTTTTTKTEAHTAVEKTHSDQLGISAASAKAYADAVERLSHVGETWQDTLAGISPGLVKDVQDMIAAGAAAKDLAIAWGIPLPVMTAIELKTKDTAAALTLTDKIAADSAISWAQYFKDVADLGADSVLKLKAGTQAWLEDQIAKHVLAKTDTADFYNFVYAEAALKDQKIEQSALQGDVHSKAHFELIADQARIAYEFATAHADQYTTEWITQLQKTADAAKLAADTFGMSFDAALGKVDAHIKSTIDGFHQLQMASASATLPSSVGAVNPVTGVGVGNTDPLVWSYLGMGYTIGEAVAKATGNGASIGPPHGHWTATGWVEGRAQGGPVVAGQSYLVGDRADRQPEIFTPGANGFITPLGNGGKTPPNVTINLYGTPAELAQQVKAIMLRDVLQGIKV